jgi:hypothetical protein
VEASVTFWIRGTTNQSSQSQTAGLRVSFLQGLQTGTSVTGFAPKSLQSSVARGGAGGLGSQSQKQVAGKVG